MTVHNLTPSSDQDSDIADSMQPTILEEAQDFIMSSDCEAPDVYSPPPHIAARIYKSRNYHRRSSAASSRRNSITSHHSSRSGRSTHGGPQSSHIAQHLRRASIIESRKAKAADRNAHAEKVRLRAALNKAASRATTDSEEKALAAQQAREKFLAKVKANCAAEVQRSKKVAEEQRERRAAEHLKLKEDLQERQVQAERRKALLEQSQRRPRTATQSGADGQRATRRGYIWKPRNDLEAAKILQRAWRRRAQRLSIESFIRLGLTVEAAQNMSFEDLGSRVNDEEVTQSATQLLRTFGLLDGANESTEVQAAVRTFLSCFLILGHPGNVFSKEDEQEKQLSAKAQELLLRLNQLIDSFLDINAAEDNIFPLVSEAYASFKAAFAAWRSNDSAFMIKHMVAQFVELDAIWQSVKDDAEGEVAADYKEGIRNNQTLVLSRLKKLAGPEPAMKLIRDAIRRSRKAKAKKDTGVNSKPRMASEARNASSIPLATVDSAPAGSGLTSSPSDNRHAAKELLQSSSSLVPESRLVMHELAINREWKIDVDKREGRRDEMIEATTTKLQQGLDAETFDRTAPEKPTFTTIKEVLDPQMVAQQVKNGTFAYQNFFNFMNSILPKLCAPVRDEEVKSLATHPSDDPVKQLARIYFVIEVLVLDVLNFQIASVAPNLLKESAGYETEAFKKSLDGRSPEKTFQWWQQSSTYAHEEASKRHQDPAQSISLRNTPHKIYMQGLTNLAISVEHLNDSTLPETLELDAPRLTRIRSDLLRLITTASILLNAKNLLRRDTRSLWKAEAARMWELPFTSSTTSFVSIVESRYALPPTTKTQLTSFVTRVLGEAKEGRANHPVMKVLLAKIKGHVLARLGAQSAEERNKSAGSANEVLGSAGMVEFVGRIGDIVQELGRVADVDREAHARWYDGIIERMGREREEVND
ncbi:uncharacterized protein KY384_006877 [Bacidia gigantensis]|uniref:uncharacterized protein n=1 Tax=Bacidia gigantensis TaxID=2732470 RepID=UPI001D049D3E|nr:uncharacterized protein KY384_006877 [Bacidia gigantensis]KAG8527961.1 hypothetical protein KY384_006877 [Bacidia gigantensis]